MRFAPLLLLLAVGPASALEPKEVFLLANKAVPESKEVAEHYMNVRKVPKGNLVLLDLPTGEDISRADYETKLVAPLRAALKNKKASAKVILTVYGVPLRVGGQQSTDKEKADLKEVDAKLEAVRKEIAELEKAKPKDDAKIRDAKKKLDPLLADQAKLSHRESTSSVDSELMMLWADPYPLARWVVNPMHWQIPDGARKQLPTGIMTCRLDGPTPEIAKRLVDDAVAVEKVRLKGKVYVDARGIKFDKKKPGEQGTGYEGYDESFREMAELLKASGMDVVLDDKQELFKPDSCPDAALYAGWYSHANYIPCCKFAKGAVAWHLASSEATTLHKPDSKVWCPNLLKAGVAATIGPVAEPYTVGFPKPSEFFGYLTTGKYTLVECYAKTTMFASWMGVLVGDPLYTPFAKDPVVKEDAIKPSPQGVRVFW